MNKTKIDWCDSTWNPVTGCLHGCEYCYAIGQAHRFGGHADLDYFLKTEENPEIRDEKIHVLDKPLARYEFEATAAPYPFGFEPTLYRYRLNEYISKQGRNIFVCSMADLFGEWVPDSWIEEVFKTCEKAPQHNYLFLTKNPERYVKLALREKLPTKENMWYGSTMTEPDMESFFSKYHKTFWSIEPILKPFRRMEESKKQLPDWIICGAETGRRKDKVVPKREWIEDILEDCRQRNIPLFMKSSLADIWGEPLIQEFPKELQIN